MFIRWRSRAWQKVSLNSRRNSTSRKSRTYSNRERAVRANPKGQSYPNQRTRMTSRLEELLSP
jgi:hypothetical protein